MFRDMCYHLLNNHSQTYTWLPAQTPNSLIQSRGRRKLKILHITVADSMWKLESTKSVIQVASTCPPCTSHWKVQLILIRDSGNGKGFFCFVLFFKWLKKKCQQCQLLLLLFEKNYQMENENWWNARESCKFCIDKLDIWWQRLRKPPLFIKLISGLNWNLQ